MTTTTLPIGIVPGLSFDEYADDPGLNCSKIKRYRNSTEEGVSSSEEPERISGPLVGGRALHEYMEDQDRFNELAVVVKGLWPGSGDDKFEAAVKAHPGQIVLAETWDKSVPRMATAMLEHPMASQYLAIPSQREVSLFWDDPDLGVRCKARLDRLNARGIVDLKTTGRALDDHTLGNTINNYGYHMQAAWYTRALKQCRGDANPRFVFVFVRSSRPYTVRCIDLETEDIRFGWAGCVRAARRLLEFKRTGVVPVPYPDTRTCRVSPYSPEHGLKVDIEL